MFDDESAARGRLAIVAQPVRLEMGVEQVVRGKAREAVHLVCQAIGREWQRHEHRGVDPPIFAEGHPHHRAAPLLTV